MWLGETLADDRRAPSAVLAERNMEVAGMSVSVSVSVRVSVRVSVSVM